MYSYIQKQISGSDHKAHYLGVLRLEKLPLNGDLLTDLCDEILQRRNYLLKILLKYGGVLESKDEAITEIEIINHLYDNGEKKALKGFEQQRQCTKRF